MCGIVGLHLKDDTLMSRLGELLTPMLVSLTSRGPDSAGIALYDDDVPEGLLRFSLRAPGEGFDWNVVVADLERVLAASIDLRKIASDAVLIVESENPGAVLEALSTSAPDVGVTSYGECIEVFKDVGAPADIARRYKIVERSGYQGLGHTRMATESAVTTEHSHPFAAGLDLCLVHNGSFSNYDSVRRRLRVDGVKFDTDNDSEVAARYIGCQLQNGADLRLAIKQMMGELDGVYTLLVATAQQFAVVRDSFALKPAVLAETKSYVAMASEYHALSDLPDIEEAHVFEPMPGEIHLWSR